MGEAKPTENTTISAPRWAPVRVRNSDDGGGNDSNTKSAVLAVRIVARRHEKP